MLGKTNISVRRVSIFKESHLVVVEGPLTGTRLPKLVMMSITTCMFTCSSCSPISRKKQTHYARHLSFMLPRSTKKINMFMSCQIMINYVMSRHATVNVQEPRDGQMHEMKFVVRKVSCQEVKM